MSATSKPLTVGLELECVRASLAFPRLADRRNFGRRTDASILDANGRKLPTHGPTQGVEIVTPILEVTSDLSTENGISTFNFDYKDVPGVIADLSACADYVNSSCGVHVHLGKPNGEASEWNPRRMEGISGGQMSEWKPGHVRTWILIGMALEDRLYSVVPETRRRSRHCRRIGEVYGSADIMSYYPVGTPVARKQENSKRYCWLNLIETRRVGDPRETRVGYSRSKAFGTVEIRMLGETSRADYMTAWTKLWIKVAMAVAYLPAESAALYCAYSSYLQQDFDALARCKERHERTDVAVNRINVLDTAVSQDGGDE